MKKVTTLAMIGAAVLLAGCGEGFRGIPADKSVDLGVNEHNLSTMVAGIWVDPNGCDHWIIDDGVEGYLSERLTPDGRPVCSGVATPNTVVGEFKSGHVFPDPKGPQRTITYQRRAAATTVQTYGQ